jgi:hypothetical protein
MTGCDHHCDRSFFMEAIHLKEFEALPHSSACRLISFRDAEVVPGIVNDTWFLIVSGVKPWATMKVELHPLIYIRQPEYWGIEVVGCQSGVGLPVQAPYHVSLDITHVRGTIGIEVIGATSRKQIKVG